MKKRNSESKFKESRDREYNNKQKKHYKHKNLQKIQRMSQKLQATQRAQTKKKMPKIKNGSDLEDLVQILEEISGYRKKRNNKKCR